MAILLISATIFLVSTPSITKAEVTGNTWHISPTGADSDDCGSTTAPCRNIQIAIEKASSGDTIKVAAATYTYISASDRCQQWYGTTGVLCIDRKQVTLVGGYTASNWNTPNPTANPTIIDGQNTHRGVFVLETTAGPTALTMEGFTIRNGLAKGIPARGGEDAIFAFGGGMFVDRAQLTLRHVIFENNKSVGENTSTAYGGSGSGGGLAMRGSPYLSILEHVTFRNNEARGGVGPERGGLGLGGGMYTYRSNSRSYYLTFTNNLAQGGSSNGSGISIGEKADAQGGGVAVQIGCNSEFHNLTVTNNQALGGNAPNGSSGGAFGGGVFSEQASLVVTDALVQNNLAQGGTGKNNSSPPFSMGGGIATDASTLLVDRSQILGNTARGGSSTFLAGPGGGGGIAVQRLAGSTLTTIHNTIIANNTANMGDGPDKSAGGGGGGLYFNGAVATVEHSTIANNVLGTSPMQGIGALVFGYATATPANVTIKYSIIANHTAYAGAAALHTQAGSALTLNTGLFDGNTVNIIGAANGTETMISGLARFVDAANLDFHIRSDSAAINAAAQSTAVLDVDAETRNVQRDIGADEYVPLIPEITAVYAIPTSSSAIRVQWQTINMGGALHHYTLTVTCPPGGSAPNQMACNAPTNIGTVNSYQLTGLTNFKQYSFKVEAYDAGNALLDTKQVTAVPTNIFVMLPIVQK
ncbi:MAG: hypothetical protein IPM39_13940 [Chloroflexi bacterium]|nr:hypothetical protein [Chloroflexota bacterium]